MSKGAFWIERRAKRRVENYYQGREIVADDGAVTMHPWRISWLFKNLENSSSGEICCKMGDDDDHDASVENSSSGHGVSSLANSV